MTVIAVKVVPRASRDEIVGWLGGQLKVRVRAPPQDGRANRAVETLLADALDLKSSAVSVAGGFGSAQKRVRIDGLSHEEIVARLTVR